MTCNGPVLSLPVTGLLPLHWPEAAQLSASVAAQLKIASSATGSAMIPAVMLLPDFLPRADIVNLGLRGAATLIATDCEVEPPLPLQVKVNVLSAVNPTRTSLPLVTLPPLHDPEAEQLVVFADDQFSVTVPL